VFFSASDVPMTEEQSKTLLARPALRSARSCQSTTSKDLRTAIHRMCSQTSISANQTVERLDRKAESGREAAGPRHRGGAPVGRFRHDIHFLDYLAKVAAFQRRWA
jgi:hypothetical protein